MHIFLYSPTLPRGAKSRPSNNPTSTQNHQPCHEKKPTRLQLYQLAPPPSAPHPATPRRDRPRSIYVATAIPRCSLRRAILFAARNAVIGCFTRREPRGEFFFFLGVRRGSGYGKIIEQEGSGIGKWGEKWMKRDIPKEPCADLSSGAARMVQFEAR